MEKRLKDKQSTKKPEDWSTGTPPKTGRLHGSGRESRSCSTCGSRRITHVSTNSVRHR